MTAGMSTNIIDNLPSENKEGFIKTTAKNMLAKNADPRFVSGVTGLSMAEVMSLKSEL